MRQESYGAESSSVLSSFEGADNEDNLSTKGVGFRVAPPDTDGDVGPSHYVQMINLVTTIFNKNGNIAANGGPFPSSAFWYGSGGNCEPFNQGDPVVVYDETNDRWLVSQFAFDKNFTTFSQCIAVSQTGDPTGAYNRYEFNFDGIGLPDYPKYGIVTDSFTMTANIFSPPFFFFSGTLIAAIDKNAMYAGQTATLVGFNLGGGQFGFLPADLDDPADLENPSGTASFTPALFATAMSRRNRFDIWEIDVDWANPLGATRSRVDDVRISNFDSDLCSASREACIPQPNGGPALEAISDRLMHRLQIRDFGSHKSTCWQPIPWMPTGTARPVSAGTRCARTPTTAVGPSIRKPPTPPAMASTDGCLSIAMNAAVEIGMGFLVSSTSEPLGARVTGQTAAASGSGNMDAIEPICRAGVTEQTGTVRSGDYSVLSVDPVSDTFWHTNEYGQRNDKAAGWGTYVCEFEVVSVVPPPCTDGDGDGYGNPGSASLPERFGYRLRRRQPGRQSRGDGELHQQVRRQLRRQNRRRRPGLPGRELYPWAEGGFLRQQRQMLLEQLQGQARQQNL